MLSRRAFLAAYGRLRRMLERTPEYQAFRLAVLQRDRYRCRGCGSVARVVHHRVRVARNPRLALVPINGEVRCSDCHAVIHPHLRRAS